MDEPIVSNLAPIPEEAKNQKIIKKAIIYAILFDIGGSFLLGVISGYVYMVVITGGKFVYYSDLTRELQENFGFSILTIIFGTLISVMAGYLVAQLGKHRAYAHALWASLLLSAVFFVGTFSKVTLIFTRTSEVTTLDMFGIVAAPINVVAYLVGAHIYTLVQKNLHETK